MGVVGGQHEWLASPWERPEGPGCVEQHGRMREEEHAGTLHVGFASCIHVIVRRAGRGAKPPALVEPHDTGIRYVQVLARGQPS